MFGYYVRLALRSFGRNKVLTALMVLAIALGIGASMTTLTVFYVLSGDPIPQKSDRLFYVQVDAQPKAGYQPGEEPDLQNTRFDAEALLREKRAKRQALMTGGSVAIEPRKSGLKPFKSEVRFTSADFFPMFDTPFLYGHGWTGTEDERHERVVVISRKLNEKLFDGADSVGRELRMDQNTFRIVGVLDTWEPKPRFYDVTNTYGSDEQAYLPFSVAMDLKMDRNGSMNCFGDNNGDQTALNAPCAWVQYWVELENPAQAADYKAYLENYSSQQRAAGRFQRPNNVRLRDVMQWLDHNEVVPGDVRLQLWLAMGFLLVCLLNTVGLLLAKFLRRSGEIGVRRALGASRGAIFAQCLVEAGAIGLAGGVAGLGLAMLGLWAVRQQPASYAKLAHLDPSMLALTFTMAVGASLLAGLLPSWRAIQVAPALQLKS
ncbi:MULTISPECIES: ABC transporter permease [Xanthomonas]|uniref:ABC transporter permease n=1 Tax=Xanthomonas rydalmerensis TaxID=3046274 RepID=A0ABZ0JLQ2_9XANT|nr:MULTISPECIES: ABC transporter permease [unclassified Xanthomonas]MBB5878728.1 putative ABC transport system permease protein [Xanthomonas sp. 3498]WOS40351.1 ABC transporter permease [Xanthomonas sp. DM-2023]WOS44535.1 ABC transporter permease [Xanthomonas sp. DM-2023]WOS48715.1 ABC transporter permease [Xanthomonas sp. DM-2023]WOS52895.1 ABC transporter permease [Xanthomonas sp. DM-2023]